MKMTITALTRSALASIAIFIFVAGYSGMANSHPSDNPMTTHAQFQDSSNEQNQINGFTVGMQNLLYDDFDGHGCEQADGSHLAEDGKLCTTLWYGDANIVRKYNHRNVAEISMPSGENGYEDFLSLENRHLIHVAEFKTFSADFMIPSSSSSESYSVGFSYSGGILSSEDDRSWSANIGIYRYDNSVGIGMGWYYALTEEIAEHNIQARFDKWYNLRMDIRALSQEKLKIDFYVDDRLEYSVITNAGTTLLDPEKMEWGPCRSISLWKEYKAGNASVFIDNVKAAYADIVKPIVPLFDDFDGNGGKQPDGRQLAVSGELSSYLWYNIGNFTKVVNAQTYLHPEQADDHGFILKLVKEDDVGGCEILRMLPYFMRWQDVKSISFDMLVPSTMLGKEFGGGLDLHGGRIASWYVQIKVSIDSDGQCFAIANMGDAMGVSDDTKWHQYKVLRALELDEWHNFRVDITEVDSLLRFDYYVNDILQYSVTPPADKHPTAGPRRQFGAGNDVTDPNRYIFIDNVRAVCDSLYFPIYVPLHLSAEKALDRSLLQQDHINVLTWEANQKNNIINFKKYRIYMLEAGQKTLLIQLGGQTFCYSHRGIDRNKTYTYAICAVSEEGDEGELAYVTIR